MLKFQIGKLTFKNFLLHWCLSLVVIAINMFLLEYDFDLFMLLVLSFIPGMFISILIIASIKEILKAIKEKEYITLLVMVIFIVIFTKYYYSL